MWWGCGCDCSIYSSSGTSQEQVGATPHRNAPLLEMAGMGGVSAEERLHIPAGCGSRPSRRRDGAAEGAAVSNGGCASSLNHREATFPPLDLCTGLRAKLMHRSCNYRPPFPSGPEAYVAMASAESSVSIPSRIGADVGLTISKSSSVVSKEEKKGQGPLLQPIRFSRRTRG